MRTKKEIKAKIKEVKSDIKTLEDVLRVSTKEEKKFISTLIGAAKKQIHLLRWVLGKEESSS